MDVDPSRPVSEGGLRALILAATFRGRGGVLDRLDQLQPAPRGARLAAWSAEGPAERFRARLYRERDA